MKYLSRLQCILYDKTFVKVLLVTCLYKFENVGTSAHVVLSIYIQMHVLYILFVIQLSSM